MKIVLIGVVVLAILGGSILALHMHATPNKTVASSTSKTEPAKKTTAKASTAGSATTAQTSAPTGGSSASSNSPAAAPKSTPAPATTPSPLSITVTANDDSASPETINAKKGQTVNLTFAVSTNGTYHGGLDFKNSGLGLDSGSIAEGSSKTMTFTASQTFKFTPFWYQSDVQKDYFVTVNVT